MIPTRSRGHRWAQISVGLAVLTAVIAGSVGLARPYWSRPRTYENLPRAVAQRVQLKKAVNAFGQLECAAKTLIECELENLSVGTRTGAMVASGSSTIIELIPDGTMVQKGDVLARLDASEYEELVRQQEIKLMEARSEREKTRLSLEAARLRLQEYTLGSLEQTRDAYRSRLTVLEADRSRQVDRLAWSERMLKHGYIAEGQIIRDRLAMQKTDIDLRKAQFQVKTLEKYTAPVVIRRLETAIQNLEFELSFQDLRVQRVESKLAQLQKQVEACTIRAPHDGQLIYANEPDDDPRIELGAIVRQKMDLFYLPSFDDMEVHTMIHESIIDRVAVGMPASIRLEALPQYRLEGQVVSISTLPFQPKNWRAANDVKHFIAKIRLNSVPPKVMPGMSAEVEIISDVRPDALTVPSSAITMEAGHEVCYVATPEGLARRAVEAVPGDRDVVEIKAGLQEGEEVILEPSRLEGRPAALALDGPAPALEVEAERGGLAFTVPGSSSEPQPEPDASALGRPARTLAVGLNAGSAPSGRDGSSGAAN